MMHGGGRDSIAEGIPTDTIASIQTRRSMQASRSPRSIDHHHRLSSGSFSYSRGDREGLIHSYDEENGGFGLTDLTEETESDVEDDGGQRKTERKQSQNYLLNHLNHDHTNDTATTTIRSKRLPNG